MQPILRLNSINLCTLINHLEKGGESRGFVQKSLLKLHLLPPPFLPLPAAIAGVAVEPLPQIPSPHMPPLAIVSFGKVLEGVHVHWAQQIIHVLKCILVTFPPSKVHLYLQQVCNISMIHCFNDAGLMTLSQLRRQSNCNLMCVLFTISLISSLAWLVTSKPEALKLNQEEEPKRHFHFELNSISHS